MRTRTKYQSKPAAVRHVLRLLFRSKQGKSCTEEENDDEEEGRGPQIIVLPRITLNKHLGFRRDPFLSSFPVYKETKISGLKEQKLKNKRIPSTTKHLL
jgi:hypothetical protein